MVAGYQLSVVSDQLAVSNKPTTGSKQQAAFNN
jgi:hypothetical protein